MKKTLRQHMLTRRMALAEEERTKAGLRLQSAALSLLHSLDYTTIAGYWPIKGEINALPLLEELHRQGKCCALPVMQENSRLLQFHRWVPGMPLTNGGYGILQPGDTSIPEALLPDVVLVPLLAFDVQNHRLGYGGGYYDATLAWLENVHPSFKAFGCAYEWQEVSFIETGPHDKPLHGILRG